MGVEPTMASSSLPINGFEDRGGHQVSTTPTCWYHTQFGLSSQGCRPTDERPHRSLGHGRFHGASYLGG